MEITNPGQITTLSKSGIPAGSPVGFQIIKASTEAVTLARTTNGVTETPIGSGNFVLTFNAPAEPDLYLVVLDWNNGAIVPASSAVLELRVQTDTSSVAMATVASYAQMYLGTSTWRLLLDPEIHGEDQINQLIGVIKARTFQSPPADESTLPVVVLNYLGLLTAIALAPPARMAWASKPYSFSKGNEPVETIVYSDRAKLMDDLVADLRQKLQAAQEDVLGLINDPMLIASAGPAIDEEIVGARVTDDPRLFPNEHTFPYAANGWFGRYQ